MRTEWKGAGVTSSEERQGKEEWMCVLGRGVILLGFWDARCDTNSYFSSSHKVFLKL